MKGIALALETIVVLIIAVSILSILLWFLYSNVTPTQQQTDLERLKTQYCGSYVRADPRCEGGLQPGQTTRVPINTPALKSIRDTCKNLHEKGWGSFESCTNVGDGDLLTQGMLTCIKDCCNMFCA